MNNCIRKVDTHIADTQTRAANRVQRATNAVVHRQTVMRDCLQLRVDKLREYGVGEESIGCCETAGKFFRQDVADVSLFHVV